jgi:imidazolonepropionase-like amidohydrolase
MTALKSATSQPALALGVEAETGSVSEGLVADLIAVQGNPLEDIGSLRRVVFVMRNGRVTSEPQAGKGIGSALLTPG